MTTTQCTTPVPGTDLRECIVDINKWLYLASPMSFDDEPKVTIYFYPLGVRTHDFLRNYETPLPITVRGDSTSEYSQVLDSAAYRPIRFRLKDGGQTHADFVYTVPVQQPKVRAGLEVQFRRGRWMKYLKSKGWVTA